MTNDKEVKTFEKPRSGVHIVIPVRSGIQYYQEVPGFRIKPRMTEQGVFQRSQVVIADVSIGLDRLVRGPFVLPGRDMVISW
ncbi:MAG TPA: hypothetical protein PLU95_01665 [Syntrophales bacterium]|nr:hypothetical protein [Syntrophales bacterium]HPN07983.1 hypothetical protein [Syntrophales bacterium]HPX82765.1 hypothetical protein [Syntrophales bacterium]